MSRGIRLITLALLAASLATASGCAVGRHDMPELTDIPEEYSSSGEAVRADAWWLDLNDPALNTIIEEGLRGNLDLAMSWDRLDQAKALANKAGASVFPSISIDGSVTRSGQWGEGVSESYTTTYAAGPSASYEIDLWGRVRSTREAAVLDVLGSREDLRTAGLSLTATIASTWYQVAEAKTAVDETAGQVEANEQMLEIVTLKYQGGQVGATDVLRQQQVLESSTGSLELAEARLEVLRNQLAVLLGRAPQRHVDDSGARLIELPPLPQTGVPAELLQQRPDVKAAELDVAAASARLGAAVADRFPRISISATASTSGVETADLFTNWLGNLVGNITLPLLDGGSRKAEAERQEAVVSETFHRYRQTVLGALAEVEDALVLEERQATYVASVDRQLELATAVLERTTDAYLGGQTTYLNVLEALTSQQTLARQQSTARRELIGYRIDLCRALGGGWTPERPTNATSGSDGRTS